jgi:hypothetical protein
MLSQFRAILHQFKPFGTACFLADTVITHTGFGTFEPNIFSRHCNTLTIKQKLASARNKQNEKESNLNTALTNRSITERYYSTTFVTKPEPTVFPPSRMANRLPSVRAIGFPNSTSKPTLSPGMHISAPPSRLVVPVTSVVRK